jgi:hypothetical protein
MLCKLGYHSEGTRFGMCRVFGMHPYRRNYMANFASQPPSQKVVPLGKLFRGGMMPATGQDVAALIVFDIRSLKLPAAEGKAIELAVRDFILKEIEKRVPLTNRSAIDLSTSVFGIAID